MSEFIKKQTEYYLKDLHARETMRMTWYRHYKNSDQIQQLRIKKAQHRAFLNDLLRRRSLKPIWYAPFFYYIGHLFGILSAFLPPKMIRLIEQTLEFWLLMRYEKYLKKLRLQFDVRSMIEAMQMKKLNHDEPGTDVIQTLEQFISNERDILQN